MEHCGKHDKVFSEGATCPGCEFERVAAQVAADMNGQGGLPSAEDLDKAEAEKPVSQ